MFAKKKNPVPVNYIGIDDRIKKSKTHHLELGTNTKGQAVIRQVPKFTKDGISLGINFNELNTLTKLLKDNISYNNQDLKNNEVHNDDIETKLLDNRQFNDIIKKLNNYKKTGKQPRFTQDEVGQINVATYAELLYQNEKKERNYKLIDSIESKSDLRYSS